MKRNIGILDKILRVSIAILLGVLLYFNLIDNELLTYVLTFLVGILIITSLFEFCPLYFVFNTGTKKSNSESINK